MKKKLIVFAAAAAVLASAITVNAGTLYTMTYLPGTEDAVTNLADPDECDGGAAYTVTDKTPERDGYEFLGWTLDYSVADHLSVTYVAEPDSVYGVPDDASVIIDDTEYQPGDPVEVKKNVTSSQRFACVDGEDVPGIWTFTCDRENFNIRQNTTIPGQWSFEPDTYKLTYNMVGDSTYGVPADAKAPEEISGIKWKGSVSSFASAPTTSWKTSNGKEDGIPGTWAFSAVWSSGKSCSDELKKIENIKTDQNVYGKWIFTPTPTYSVSYSVSPDPVYGYPEDYESAPIDTKAYYAGDPVLVVPALTTSCTYARDRYGFFVSGSWTFSGWDHEEFNISENTEISGSWTFEEPPTYSYEVWYMDFMSGKILYPSTVRTDIAPGTYCVETAPMVRDYIPLNSPLEFIVDDDGMVYRILYRYVGGGELG